MVAPAGIVEFALIYIVLPAPVVVPLTPSKFPLIVKEPVPVQEIFPYMDKLRQVLSVLSIVIFAFVLIQTLFIEISGGAATGNAPTHVPFVMHLTQFAATPQDLNDPSLYNVP
jgi:hypothetical protein